MAFVEIFRSPCRRRYFSTLISKALFVHYGFIITAIFISLIIAYTTKGFYVFTNQIVEDPVVNILKSNIYCVLGIENKTLYYGLPSINSNLYANSYRVPSLNFQAIDSNSDGLNDIHNINIEFPMNSNEKIYSFQIFIGFDFQLRRLTRLELKDYAYFEYSGGLNAANLTVNADLLFQQNAPLNYQNYILISLPTITPTNVDDVLDSFYSQKASLVVKNQFVQWQTGRSGTDAFKVKIALNINPATLIYKPGFWFTAKWAWIQFASIAIFAFYFQQLIKEFLFKNKYIPSIVIMSDLECHCLSKDKKI